MTFLVTGISSGIGHELSKTILNNGHNLIGCSRSNASFSMFQNYAKSSGATFQGLVIDFDQLNNGEIDFRQVFGENLEKLDALVLNAGLLIKGDLNELKMDDVRAMMEANVYYPMLLLKMIDEQNLIAQKAHIVSISSMGGFQGSLKFPKLLGYSISKSALACLSECLAEEWSEKYSVNCLCLGAVNTEMLSEAFPDFIADISAEQMARYIYDFTISASTVMSGKVLSVTKKSM